MGLLFGSPSLGGGVVSVPDPAKAVRAFAEGRALEYAASVSGMQPGDAARLWSDLRAKDDALLVELCQETVKTEAEAVAALKRDDAAFPASEYVACVKEAVGSKVKPATWAEVVSAAKAEAVAAPVGELGGK